MKYIKVHNILVLHTCWDKDVLWDIWYSAGKWREPIFFYRILIIQLYQPLYIAITFLVDWGSTVLFLLHYINFKLVLNWKCHSLLFLFLGVSSFVGVGCTIAYRWKNIVFNWKKFFVTWDKWSFILKYAVQFTALCGCSNVLGFFSGWEDCCTSWRGTWGWRNNSPSKWTRSMVVFEYVYVVYFYVIVFCLLISVTLFQQEHQYILPFQV